VSPAGVAVVSARRGALQVVGRLGWGVADQAVSSLSNFALGLYVARTFGASGLGVFALALVTYSLVLNAARGAATDPLLVRYSGAARRRWRRATASATGTALLVGAAAAMVCLVAGLLLPAPVGGAFLALAVGLPGLMLQDSWRFAFFAAGRPKSALVNDVVWSLLLLVALVAMHRVGEVSVVQCLLAFGATGFLAALVGSVQAGVLPRPSAAFAWVSEHRELAWRYLTENLSLSVAAWLRSFSVGAVAGLAVLGEVRAAEMLMGPFLVVLMGVSQVAVPEASRVLHASPARLTHFCFALGGAQAIAALAWGLGLIVVLPLGPGQVLFAELWGPTSQLLLGVTFNVAAACFCSSAIACLRATGVARRSLRAQLIASVAYLVGGVVGVVVAGAPGTVWGAALANAFSALVWWHQLKAALAEHRNELSGVTG
jgi:O-antigen/teichoic acid export membrane protein